MKHILKLLKNKKVVRGLIAGVSVVILIVLYIFYQLTQGRVFIDNSLVQAPIISLSPQTAGTLSELDVREGQMVKKGDSLAIVGGHILHADTNGLIVTANNQVGTEFSTQNPVIQMINTADLRIAGTIDENKGLSDVHVGQVASFTVDAFPGKTYWGYVDEVSPSSKETQIAFSISSERPTQQFVVYVRFDSLTYPEIKNGMSAKLTIYTNTH